MIKKFACVTLIFLSIQVMNLFLIHTGSMLEEYLSGSTNPRFMVGVYQQMFQASLGILLFRLFFGKGISEMGINTKSQDISFRYFGFFALAWVSIMILYVSIVHAWFPMAWESMTTLELPQSKTIAATLLFQSFFPGFGEEVLFRGLIVSVLIAWVFPRYQESRSSKMGVVIISSLYFATAHIYFSLEPFRLMHLDYLQLAVALGCGAFYAVAFLKTKSLLAPFLAHNFSNTTSTIFGYIISAV